MFRRAPWMITGLLLWSGILGGAREIDEAWIRGIFTGRSPRPISMPAPDAWRQAHEIAGQTPDAMVLVGSGQSMQPLYAPGIILVTQPCAYGELKPGQTALYRTKAGKIVAHVLITKARDGWRASGLNTLSHDMEPVLAENLVGVVVAAFQPAGPARVSVVASAGRP